MLGVIAAPPMVKDAKDQGVINQGNGAPPGEPVVPGTVELVQSSTSGARMEESKFGDTNTLVQQLLRENREVSVSFQANSSFAMLHGLVLDGNAVAIGVRGDARYTG